MKNGLPNGKGKKFNKNDNIIYEGDFINGKYEGKGHLSLGKEKYYYGYFKNGEFEGKGILYQKWEKKFIFSENIDKKVTYLRNEVEMIANFNNIHRENKDGPKKYNVIVYYEGDFIRGKYNGKGKQLLSDLEYYIG